MDTSKQCVRQYRHWSNSEKQRIVLETLEPGASVSRVAQQYAANTNMVFMWRKQYREGRLTNGVEGSLLPVKVSDERLVGVANIEQAARRGPLGDIEIQLRKGKLHITGRVDLLTLRTAIECLT